MAIPDLVRGVLPPGLHTCTFQEVTDTYCYGGPSSRRSVIWSRAKDYIDLFRPLGVFNAVYVDGSFVTDKPEPGDVDIVLETQLPTAQAIGRLQNYSMIHALDIEWAHHHYDSHPYLATTDDSYYLDLFQKMRDGDCMARGFPNGAPKGILRLSL